MMITELSTVFSILLLWVMVFWFWRDYRIDRFRNEMFALRDELFDLARTGVLRFDMPAYGLLRTTMNGFIRFGDRIGFTSLIMASWMMRRHSDEAKTFHAKFGVARNDLSADQRQAIDAVVLRMNDLVTEQLILASPVVLMTVVAPIVLIVLMQIAGGKLASLLKRGLIPKVWTDPLDSVAMQCGKN